MKRLIFLSLFIITNYAQASNKSIAHQSSPSKLQSTASLANTAYSQIYSLMLDAGVGYYDHEINSLWSGRCFTNSNPNTAIAAALIFRDYNDRGPIGNGLAIASIWSPNSSPEYYDKKSPYDIRGANFVTPVLDYRRNSHYLYLNNGTKTALRQDHRYIYEAVLDEHGQTSVICYYFIKNY